MTIKQGLIRAHKAFEMSKSSKSWDRRQAKMELAYAVFNLRRVLQQFESRWPDGTAPEKDQKEYDEAEMIVWSFDRIQAKQS